MSRSAADRHYGPSVDNALAEGAIHIGRPKPPPGWKHYGIQDGRYVIIEDIKEPEEMAKAVAPDVLESIGFMIVNGNRLDLPQDRQFKNYAQVKVTLTRAGGRYNKSGFIFDEPAEGIKKRLCGGEQINDKKDFQFFHTPDGLAADLVEHAYLSTGLRVGEPSAGRGHIVSAIEESGHEVALYLMELMPKNCEHLRKAGYPVEEMDFLTCTPEQFGLFDRFIANPPFTKNQDIDHIKHMHSLLKPDGRLVSCASRSWMTGTQKKQKAFREWLDEVDADVYDIAPGTFKEAGTSVGGAIVVIQNKG